VSAARPGVFVPRRPNEEVERDIMDDARTEAAGQPVAGAPSFRRLLTPRWIGFTGLVLLAVVAFLFLAWWQLSRFESTSGSWQNLGYTLQWPFFAAFAVYLWWKLLRDPGAPQNSERVGTDVSGEGRPESVTRGAEEGERADGVLPGGDDAVLPPLPSKRPVGSDQWAGQAEPADPELEAYNDYLEALHRRSQKVASPGTRSDNIASRSGGSPSATSGNATNATSGSKR
jgi:DNA-binding transcriptional regulator of glucitol operon